MHDQNIVSLCSETQSDISECSSSRDRQQGHSNNQGYGQKGSLTHMAVTSQLGQIYLDIDWKWDGAIISSTSSKGSRKHLAVMGQKPPNTPNGCFKQGQFYIYRTSRSQHQYIFSKLEIKPNLKGCTVINRGVIIEWGCVYMAVN